ncbi:MAG: hypothetical protein A2Z08_06365 [Deltaproteobacteria bacterium RBG_16_54_11]|nr:MAG: hypothetical protein A2Z08_06365 [Deltaproteobacteria bacterium RBG_16_54_11]
MIKAKRIYDEPEKKDGFRILVDRLWPRGLSKDRAQLDLWLREAAPSDALRKWFGHDPARWDEFKRRYFKELEDKTEAVESIVTKASQGSVTLLYGAKDVYYNNAVALRGFVEQRAENQYMEERGESHDAHRTFNDRAQTHRAHGRRVERRDARHTKKG